jgi:gliding motility-associated-like protein
LPCNTVLQNDTITVHIIPALTVNLGNDTILCTGQNLTLNAGNAGATYLWSTGAVTQTINVNSTANYKVTVTAGSCSIVDSILVTFNNGPVLALGNDTSLCAGQPITISAGNPGATYLWSTGATTETISPDSTGSYSVAASFGTCTARDTINITFNPIPVVNLGPDQLLCNGLSVTLDAGNPGAAYLWSTGAMTETISVSATNLYWVVVQNGTCVGTDSIQITAYTSPHVNLGPDISICYGSDTSLNAGNAGMEFLWNTGDTTQTIKISSTGTYFVNVNNHGCLGSDTAIVNIGQEIYVSLGADTFICPGSTMQIDAGTGFTRYAWSPIGGNYHFIEIEQPGTYQVIVTDAYGCTGSATKYVRDFCAMNIFVPNTFTPNKDGKNDLFQAFGEGITGFHLYVFDRWGELLFESTDIAIGWDGTYNGNEAQQGSYVYRVDYQLYNYLDLQWHTQYGIVNLVR